MLTSKIEGTPISILEAMASGLVVFAPDVGAISSIIEDKQTGFLLTKDVNNDIDIIRDNFDKKDIGNNARKYVLDSHDISNISFKFLNYLIPNVDFYFPQDGDIEVIHGEYI